MSRPVKPLPATAALFAATAVLASCGGGPSDVVGADNRPSTTTLSVVAYAVPEPGWSAIVPAFTATPEGRGVAVAVSYGPSADQSRGVAQGKPADIVNFSAEPDVTRLVEAGKVAADWNSGADRGIAFGSVVTLVVRSGNPKNIADWDDLLRPGVEVVTPSPLSSGSAKWNLLAPYAATSAGGDDHRAGLEFIGDLLDGHITVRPSSGREASDVFLQGTGDVLISYENEAIHLQRQGKPIERITPPQTLKIENPVALITGHRDEAAALRRFLFTAEGQRIWAHAGFRPVDAEVAAEFAAEFPAPATLWTVADLGGWDSVDRALFDKEDGAISAMYTKAVG